MEENTQVVAVIGAGPAGLFAAKQLAADGCQVVLFNRDIKPGGLAEYGIYPEKHKMKEGLRNQFRSILSSPQICYFGNVNVGAHGNLHMDQICAMGFNAVLVTVGAQAAKKLGIPGEALTGVYNAKDVVYHYNKLPPYADMPFDIGRKIAIIGVGNVMLDLARWLIDTIEVDEITAIARRGPAEVKFDKKELEAVIANLDTSKLHDEMDRVATSMRAVGENPEESMVLYQAALEKALPHTSHTNFVLRFLSSPSKVLGDEKGHVNGLEVEETTLELHGKEIKAIGTGKKRILDVDTIIFAIGDVIDNQLGIPIERNQFVKNPHPQFPIEDISYEVMDPLTGEDLPGIFVAGWSRQSSNGVVGIARKDGTNAALAIKNYLAQQTNPPSIDRENLCNLVHRLVPYAVDYDQVQQLEALEHQKAAELNLEEYKFNTNEEMLALLGKLP